MDVDALEAAVTRDCASGLLPAGIVGCVGGTSTGAVDDVVAVARRHGLYVHVDAAWAGAAMICPEFRTLWAGVESADSLVLNPHKWLGAQFDCSAHFVRDPDALVRTLAIQPEFLKTHGREGLINYSEWSIPLGRRFRALKLWFLMRGHGLEDLRRSARLRQQRGISTLLSTSSVGWLASCSNKRGDWFSRQHQSSSTAAPSRCVSGSDPPPSTPGPIRPTSRPLGAQCC
jgi:glutamate/tyrosine decarboxylase-like PLP-dependent enzyme